MQVYLTFLVSREDVLQEWISEQRLKKENHEQVSGNYQELLAPLLRMLQLTH